TTLPSAPVTRAPRRSSACVVIVTSPPESLSPDSDGIGPQLPCPTPLTQCKYPLPAVLQRPARLRQTARHGPLYGRGDAPPRKISAECHAPWPWVDTMSGYGGIVQP